MKSTVKHFCHFLLWFLLSIFCNLISSFSATPLLITELKIHHSHTNGRPSMHVRASKIGLTQSFLIIVFRVLLKLYPSVALKAPTNTWPDSLSFSYLLNFGAWERFFFVWIITWVHIQHAHALYLSYHDHIIQWRKHEKL